MDDAIIRSCKDRINNKDMYGLQEILEAIKDETHDWQRIFLKVYLHACLKKQQDIVDWLMQVYETFDDISKIALRQTFPYGRWLLNR
jgi:hypothetical protein